MSEINTPFKDDVAPASGKNDSSNVSLQDGDPGFKKATPSGNIPSRTSRHSNLDGGQGVGNTESQSPDAVVKRVG